MNYVDTFIAIAGDSRATEGRVPPERAGGKTVAQWEYELISTQPYRYTQQEVQFRVHCARRGTEVPAGDLSQTAEWKAFFARPMACLRTSPLARTYGWGFHFDAQGRVALVGVGTPEYARWASDRTLLQTSAMRSRRA
ncbi:MAG: hypothetical protein IT580_04910 [Verrucomicrobiales bacterium]|nr:hypothetical protein [Verrucomicrobiales bacterium]